MDVPAPSMDVWLLQWISWIFVDRRGCLDGVVNALIGWRSVRRAAIE